MNQSKERIALEKIYYAGLKEVAPEICVSKHFKALFKSIWLSLTPKITNNFSLPT
ncbi:MAG: hypothetical protein H7A23_13940 [Leptospiraceae bacterium]|nr:hypothetical protein [Leptospiraceae bacterium]MCP5495651.1 hypothetical protein [Leptospiraceae bacterium]